MRVLLFIILLLGMVEAAHPPLKEIIKVAKDWSKSEVVDEPMEYIELTYAIDKYSKEYKIPPDVLYAIAEVESDYRYKLRHRTVRVSVQTRKHGRWRKRRVHAIGLCGVIYEANRFILDPIGISKQDLYTIRGNIHAAAAILRYKIDKTGSLHRGLRSYYGGGHTYNRKIAKARKRYKNFTTQYDKKPSKPKTVKKVVKTDSKYYYRVQKGDTLFSIARKTGVPAHMLIRMNKRGILTNLVINEKVRIKMKPKKKPKKVDFGERLLATAKTYLGIRYKWGGTTRRGIDCSGFTLRVFEKHNVKLPRVSGDQYHYALKHGKRVKWSEAKKGDLIFFKTRSRYVGHVGIIYDPKKRLMINATSARRYHKVAIIPYDTRMYKRRLRGIIRLNKTKG